jgi:hypothetical protein
LEEAATSAVIHVALTAPDALIDLVIVSDETSDPV